MTTESRIFIYFLANLHTRVTIAFYTSEKSNQSLHLIYCQGANRAFLPISACFHAVRTVASLTLRVFSLSLCKPFSVQNFYLLIKLLTISLYAITDFLTSMTFGKSLLKTYQHLALFALSNKERKSVLKQTFQCLFIAPRHPFPFIFMVDGIFFTEVNLTSHPVSTPFNEFFVGV